MDNIIVSMSDNVLLPQEGSNFVSSQDPVYIQENIAQGYAEPCSVQVGQTITGEPNTNAEVTNVGTEQHAVLNFVIPRGADGINGIDGIDGLDGEAATIQIGSVTTGLPDSNAQVTNVGTETSAILDFVIPRGSQGLQGEQGVAGADGISPIAYVTQTATGATIHIEDSENVTDATVTNGTDGADGFSPIATVTQNTGSATITITDKNGTTTATVYDGTAASLEWNDIQNKPNFATVAITGSYTDLTNTPTIPTVNDATLTIQKNGTDVATFTANSATNQTANITVPTNTSDLNNDSGFVTSSSLATVATTGSYTDLTNTPTIPTQYYIKAGTETIPALNSGGYTEIQVSIPTQSNTDYAVCLTLAGSTSFWTWLRFIVINKTTTSFNIGVYNDGGGGTGSVPIDYLVMKI